jgi:hypothetical protein
VGSHENQLVSVSSCETVRPCKATKKEENTDAQGGKGSRQEKQGKNVLLQA